MLAQGIFPHQYLVNFTQNFSQNQAVKRGASHTWAPAPRAVKASSRRNGSSRVRFSSPPAQAAELYRRAAEGGDRAAACNLGYLYEIGVGVDQSWTEAVKWYRQAVEESYPRAQYNLAWCYEHGKGVSRDLKRARELYQAAAQQEYGGAQEAADRLEKSGGRRNGGFLRGFLDGLRGQ